MKFTFSVSKEEINKQYEAVVNKAVQNTTLKGFRKGAAPRDMVIKAVGETKLQQDAIEQALPKAYAEEIKKRKLKPVSYPDLQLKKGKPGENFEFEAEIAEAPEIKLGDYKKLIKGELAKGKIWTPEKGHEGHDHGEMNQDQKTEAVIKLLLEKIEVKIPELLTKREVNRMLSRLVDQITNLGLKMDDYLASSGKTQEGLREEYAQTAEQNLAVEFLLMELAKDLKVEASEKDIDAFISTVGDKKLQKQLQSADQKNSLFVMLTKQNVLKKLLDLAS